MQYLIRMVCDECSDFRRDILIDEDATFLELNDIILKSCAYPDNQMTSFYICDEEWQRGEQITREDMRDNVADDFLYTMADTRLSEFLGATWSMCSTPSTIECFRFACAVKSPATVRPKW